MYCWGSTLSGELGVGAPEVEQITQPTLMKFAHTWSIKQVASGLSHSLLLTNDGRVYSCGNNEVGQLGHNKITRTPEEVNALESHSIEQVAAGDQHSLALTSWGLIYAWGENGFGQLGINSTDGHINTPHLVKSLACKQMVQLAAGSHHTLALAVDGTLYAWGLNICGQLGIGNKTSPQKEPILVTSMGATPLVHITAAGNHSAALTQAGYLATWGSNKYGQLGYKAEGYSDRPTLVPNLATYSSPIVYAALGENHTAVLDDNGKLWTFGLGRYGQLGHGSSDDISVPRTCLDLVGSKVTQVVCGRGHTLVYLPARGQVYAFGQGLSGQLGIKTPHNTNLPQVVLGPWVSPSGKSLLENTEDTQKVYVNRIYAGGDVSMARVSTEPNTAIDFCQTRPFQQPLSIQESKINQILTIGEEDVIEDDLFTYIETVFGSLVCWNNSFLKADADKDCHGVDYRLAEECIAKLGRVNRQAISDLIHSSILSIVKQMNQPMLSNECLRSFILLPLVKEFSDPTNMRELHLPYAEAVLTLNKNNSCVFKQWMKSLHVDFTIRILNAYKSVVVQILNTTSHSSSEIDRCVLLSSLKLLSLLHQENFKQGSHVARIAYEQFYIPEIGQKIDIRNDYQNWMSSRVRPMYRTDQNPISMCEYPFLFDAEAKTLLLRCDATRQMQGAIQEAVINSNPLLWMFDPAQVQFLNINIHRDNIVDDTIKQLMHHGVTDYKRPLKVHFIGEEAEDAGGVRKEFFLLLLREILNPDYGMFQQYSDTNTIWFKEGTLEAAAAYSLIGIVCGLAIYNFTIINLPFPLALYKKLLGQSVGLDDLADFDPNLVRNLHELLEYEGDDVEEIFCLNFTSTQNFYDIVKSIPLKEGGEDITVTSQNKQEYVDLLVDYKLNESIKSQYLAFHDGFYRVCGGDVLKLFQPMELMALVTGNENYNWTELQENTQYKGAYHREHQTIKMFWEVFHDLSTDQKKQFLKFLTGTDRVPILGMKCLKMIIQSTADDSYLPVAHTCVIQLDLPIYGTKEKLKFKLLQAIQQSEGFGLV